MGLEQVILEQDAEQENEAPQQAHQAENKDRRKKFEEIEPLLHNIPDGKYILKYNGSPSENYLVSKKTKKGKDGYGRETPVVEIEPLRDSVPLTRNDIPYGVRGFCFPTTGASYVHIDDADTYRVNYHENLHLRIYRTNPNHPEWEIRMLEDWRLGEE